jgi:hypothetical protein
MKRKSVGSIVNLCVILIFMTTPFFAANRYWVGSGIGNWNTMTNWSGTSGGASGSSVPGVADIAIFDGLNVSNCIIDANATVNGLIINTAYSGTISMNAGITATLGATGFSQSGGVFTGNNGNLFLNGPFLLNGGIFNSTTGTLQITGGYTYSAGTFNHNNGNVSFSATQSITGNTSFFNLLFVANGGIYTIAAGTTLTSMNNVTVSGGFAYTINTGTLEIKGDLTLTSSSNNSVNGGTATFLFNGNGPQNINSAIGSINVGSNERICSLPNIEINKMSGALNLNGLINLNGTFWKTTAGAALINPGTSTVNINSSVTFSGQNISLYNIHIYANSQIIVLSPATYILTSTNHVTINGGSYYQLNTGTLELLGDLTLINTSTSAFNGGTGTFLFDGTGTQTINSSASGLNYVCSLPNIEINKTSGALNLNGIINFNGGSWNTIAGASLMNAGTSVINVLKTCTLSGQNLNLYDIVITGNFSTITISSGLTWTSSHLITLAGSTSWYQINTGTLNAKGDVLVTNTNTSNNVGGNAVLLFDGTANQTLTGSGVAGGGRLPQVQINKTGGILTLSNNMISTDNNWTYVAGIVDATTNSSTVDFYKTSLIDGQGTSTTMAFYHTIVSGLISLGGNMDIDGDLTIRNGINNRLDVSALNNYQLNLAGNWTNNNSVTAASFNQQAGKVILDGGISQTLSLDIATNNETFYNLEIVNTGSGLTLNAPVTVSHNVNFITGNIFSSTSNLLLLNNSATSTGASNNSFVSGPVGKTGNQAFIFPVGKTTTYAPMSISAPALITNQYTAEYFPADPNTFYNVTSKDLSLNHISRCEYWMLDRTTGTSNVIVGLSWDTRSCGISNLNDLRVAQWNGTQWKDEGNGGTTGTTAIGTVISLSTVATYGPFTLASSSIDNLLPMELIEFKGLCINETRVLEWSTASESNNDYFSIESSEDALNWSLVGIVDGAGNSSVLHHYSLIDSQISDSVSYYRLKQTDYDQHVKYSQIIDVNNCDGALTENELTIYPNPSNSTFDISFNHKGTIESIEIFNVLGDQVHQSNHFQPQIDLSGNADGIYFVHFNLNKKSIVKKVTLKQ